MDSLITADKLSLIRANRLLFKQLSFVLHAGEAIHVVGQNGSGKTSLFKLLIGMLSPSEGQVRVFDKSPAAFDLEDRQQLLYLGHLPAVKKTLTVVENLAFNATIFDKVAVTPKHIEAALSALSLERFAEQYVGKLSRGQQRRVMLARLWLCMDEHITHKPLWLLDEPFTALDVDAIAVVQAKIDQHLASGGGVVLTSHQPIQLQHTIHKVQLGEAL